MRDRSSIIKGLSLTRGESSKASMTTPFCRLSVDMLILWDESQYQNSVSVLHKIGSFDALELTRRAGGSVTSVQLYT